MKSKYMVRALVTAGAAAALCAVVVPAQAATITCPSGNLCLRETNGVTVVVPSGQSQSFDPALKVDLIQNETSLSYCVEVGHIIELPIAPGATHSGDETVFAVSPGPICPG